MSRAQIAAVITWCYAAGFGLGTIPVAIHLSRHGRLPVFAGLFEAYGGPWSGRLRTPAFTARLLVFLAVTGLAAWLAWLVWNGSKTGAILSLALIPVEVVFWIGFQLPIPWALGFARVLLIVLGWSALR